MQHRSEDVVLFVCCSDDDCARLTAHLRDEGHVHEIRTAHHADELVGLIDGAASDRARAVVLLDASVEGAWAGFDALRASHLRGVPVLALCGPEEEATAYGRGVNAVVCREQWATDSGRTAARLASFWLQVAELPRLPPDAASAGGVSAGG